MQDKFYSKGGIGLKVQGNILLLGKSQFLKNDGLFVFLLLLRGSPRAFPLWGENIFAGTEAALQCKITNSLWLSWSFMFFPPKITCKSFLSKTCFPFSKTISIFQKCRKHVEVWILFMFNMNMIIKSHV